MAIKIVSKIVPRKRDGVSFLSRSTSGTTIVDGDKSAGEMLMKLFTPLTADKVELPITAGISDIKYIRANFDFFSVGGVSAMGVSGQGVSPMPGAATLGTLHNVGEWADAIPDVDRIMVQLSGATHWTSKPLSEVVGLDTAALGSYLTSNQYATQPWVTDRLGGYATTESLKVVSDKLEDFLTGSDTDNVINKWKELEVFLQGMKESDNLAVILRNKMDKDVLNRLFTALDETGNEVDPADKTKTIASIRANFGFWGVDYISAKGVSKGSGGTGGASALYQLVDVLANDTEDGVEGAAAGKALVFDGTHWRAGDAGLNESQLYSYLTTNKYLTQSAADSRYVTSSRKVIAGTGLSGGGALTSDVTLSLDTSGVVAGTYTKVMVDSYGRVTSGTNLSATDIPNLDWSKITTGKPTTLAGYGITDAYTKTEADGEYVTIATTQTVSGAKTFSATMKTASVLPSTDANSALGGTANRWSNVYSVNGVFSQNVTAKLLSASESLQIGDAYLKWDAANNAVYVVKKDGTTPVGFYSTDWLSAKGVSMSGVQTGTLVDLTDVEITNPTNGQALKYDAASKKWVNGTIDSFNVNQMWTELTKADLNKVIDASHIPTSVLDGRWVTLSTNQNITGQKTFTQNILFSNNITGIRNTAGNLVFGAGNENIFCILNDYVGPVEAKNNQLVLGNNDGYWKKVTAGQYISKVATGTSPFVVNSTTIVKNLNANFLDGRRADSFTSIIGRHSIYTSGTAPYNYIHLFRIANSVGYSTLRVDIDIKTRNHRALLFIDISTGQYPYGESGTSISISKLQLNSQGASLYYTVTKQTSGYNYYDIYYNSGAWNTGSYDVILRGINGALVFEPKNTNMNNLPSGYTEVIKTPLDGDISGNAATATALKNSRTLWGQPFNGTANVSGDMTGVGNITMSGDLKIGNGTSPNAILFYGTTGDNPGGYNHTFIAERFWGGTESSELVLFKGNDLGNGTDAVNASASGPDRIRHIAAAHLFQTYTSALSGSVESVCTSSALKSVFGIAMNRVTSYVPLQSTVASGTAPFIVASNTVVGNLNADMVDGLHLSDFDGRYVNVTGDTMTGDLAMSNTKGFNINSNARVVKTSGCWIHGGTDVANSTDANLRFGSWNGIGWYPTVSGQKVAQGNNAMWLDVRNGWLYTAGAVQTVKFVSTVGTGTQPYQCSSTTLNTNLNADYLDGYHAFGQTNAIVKSGHSVGGTTATWCRIAKYSVPNSETLTDVCFILHSSYNNRFAILNIRSRGKDYIEGQLIVSYNIDPTKIRIYYSSDKTGIELYYLAGESYSVIEANLLYSHDRNGAFNTSVSMYRNDTSSPSWSTYANASTVSLQNNVNSATTLQNTRKINGTGFNGSVDITTSYWGSTRTFYTNSHDSYRASSGVNVNGSSNVTLLLPNSIRCSDWFRSTGNTGWYNDTYGGGIYMTDSSYIRNFNSKRLRIQTDTYDTIQLVRTSGSGGASIAFYNNGGTFRGQLGCTANSWFSFDTGTATANQNVVEISPAGGIHSKAEITAKASGSDIRLKKDIQNYNAMSIINKFRSVKYHWNDIAKANSEVYNNDYDQFGLIAQDLIAGGFKHWVRDVFHDYYTVTYERLIPVVWKGLQEVDDEVTRLKRRVIFLENELKRLKTA